MVLFLNFNLLVFGEYAGDQLAGYIWSAYAFANLIQLIIVALIDTAKGFVPAFYAFIIANVLAIAMVINVKPQGNWENSM